MPKAEDGTNPEVHIWRIAPTRRDMFGFLGWGAVLTSLGIGSLAFVRFMYPRVLFEPPTEFVVPGEDEVAARLDVARTVSRRAERSALSAVADGSQVVPYLNRLSDLLWTLARWQEGESVITRSIDSD